jgi:hypothetical protein
MYSQLTQENCDGCKHDRFSPTYKKKSRNQREYMDCSDDVSNAFYGLSQTISPMEKPTKRIHLKCNTPALSSRDGTAIRMQKKQNTSFHRTNSIESFFSSDSSSIDRSLPSPPIRKKSKNVSYVTHKSMTRQSIRISDTDADALRNILHYSIILDKSGSNDEIWRDDTSLTSSSFWRDDTSLASSSSDCLASEAFQDVNRANGRCICHVGDDNISVGGDTVVIDSDRVTVSSRNSKYKESADKRKHRYFQIPNQVKVLVFSKLQWILLLLVSVCIIRCFLMLPLHTFK